MPLAGLPIESLPAWGILNDVDFIDVKLQAIPGKGFGLLATRNLAATEDTFDLPILIKVPHGVVLSGETVEEYAKIDGRFRQLLEAAGNHV